MDDMEVFLSQPPPGVTKFGPTVAVTAVTFETLEFRRTFTGLYEAARRIAEPWTVPDGWRGWPATFVLDEPTARVEQFLEEIIRRLSVGLQRAADAWAVLTGRLHIEPEDGDW